MIINININVHNYIYKIAYYILIYINALYVIIITKLVLINSNVYYNKIVIYIIVFMKINNK